MSAVISVVIPVYKVEQYIDRCVQSVLNQTYSNLEVFLVDDGSPDSCGTICDRYAKEDTRIHVIHKMNGGLSDARNAAIPYCTGEYITFIDSDDYVESEYVERLYSAIKKYDADISVCSFCQYYLETGKNIYVGGKKEKIFDPKAAIVSMLLDKDFYTCAWGKLYKISLFRKVRYPKGKLYEDLATTYRLMMLSSKVVYIPQHLYWYVQRSGSILNSNFNIRNLDLIEIVEKLESDLMEYMPEKQAAINYRVVGAYMDIIRMIENAAIRDNNIYENKIVKKIRKRVFKCVRSPYFSLPVKGQIISSIFGTYGYLSYKKLYDRVKAKRYD